MRRKRLLSSCMPVALLGFLTTTFPPAAMGQANCVAVENALRAAEQLKKGMLRTEVEKSFELDGGLTLRDEAVYTYRFCPFLKIKIIFTHSANSRVEDMESDVVESKSTLYVERPHAD